jgi:hypothetical protein
MELSVSERLRDRVSSGNTSAGGTLPGDVAPNYVGSTPTGVVVV